MDQAQQLRIKECQCACMFRHVWLEPAQKLLSPRSQGWPGRRKWSIQPFRPIYENSPGCYASPFITGFKQVQNLSFRDLGSNAQHGTFSQKWAPCLAVAGILYIGNCIGIAFALGCPK